jgi:hypothetical protein
MILKNGLIIWVQLVLIIEITYGVKIVKMDQAGGHLEEVEISKIGPQTIVILRNQ